MKRIFVFLLVFLFAASANAAPLRVGSKRFTESYVLAEILVQVARAQGLEAVHEQGLGGTAVTLRALEDGAIDVYPEYTGTLVETLARGEKLDTALSRRGLSVSRSLGFENRYALAVTRATGEKLHLTKISDLGAHPELRTGMSHEFAGRHDGWPGLAAHYGLGLSQSTLDHALAYEAIVRGSIDVTDVYTTDAKVLRYDLVVLDDDKKFFPRYDAVLVFRNRTPGLEGVVHALEEKIDARTMQQLNARAEIDGVPFAQVASDHLRGVTTSAGRPSLVEGIARAVAMHGPRHLALAFGALALSTLIGVPLGILAYERRRIGVGVLGVAGIVQTIPSLALFCFFIPLLGIGVLPALVALFLYGLLPIVRNTHAGLSSIPNDLRETSVALGLSRAERLRHVELPLASRTIMAGIKTSGVVAVGSATIAAFIGAGGFGEPISTGLSLNDVPTILHGAIPAALLALLVQGVFALAERLIVPRGMRHA